MTEKRYEDMTPDEKRASWARYIKELEEERHKGGGNAEGARHAGSARGNGDDAGDGFADPDPDPGEPPERDGAPPRGEASNGGSAYTDYGADPIERENVEPIDLWNQLDPPPLPTGVLPKVNEAHALAQGKLIGTDPAGIAMAALVVCAAAMPEDIKLRPFANNPDWEEPARLWVGLVGDVSAKKTPAIMAAVRPLQKIDADLGAQHRREMEAWNALDKEEKKRQREPQRMHLVVNSLTVEWCEKALATNEHGILVYADELAEWFGSHDRYGGKGSDRSVWLQLYNGGARTIGRIVRGVTDVSNASADLLGGIQPDRIREIARQLSDDGLLQRIIPVMIGPSSVAVDAPQGQEARRYQNLVKALYGLRKRQTSAGDPIVNRRLKFSTEAQAAFYRRLQANHELAAAVATLNKKAATAIGKNDGTLVRLCVLFHVIEHIDSDIPHEVSLDTYQRAEHLLTEFIRPHQFAFFFGVLGLTDDHDILAKIAGLILVKGLDVVTNRIVERAGLTKGKPDNFTVQPLFEQLYAYGWLLSVERKRANDPGSWRVNPRVHELFQERRGIEQAERARAQAIITQVFNLKRG